MVVGGGKKTQMESKANKKPHGMTRTYLKGRRDRMVEQVETRRAFPNYHTPPPTPNNVQKTAYKRKTRLKSYTVPGKGCSAQHVVSIDVVLLRFQV